MRKIKGLNTKASISDTNSSSNWWKVIARETISGYRKDVISRIHGGGARDRKKKLLEKQKKGKARMRQFGNVDIPQEAFIEVLKINKNE